MSLEKFIENFEEAVEDLEPGSVEPQTRYRDLEVWDSLAVLTVLAMVDGEYDVRLRAPDLQECETIEALWKRIRGRSEGAA